MTSRMVPIGITSSHNCERDYLIKHQPVVLLPRRLDLVAVVMPRSCNLGFAAPDRTTERLGAPTRRRLSNIAQFLVSSVSVAHGRSGLPGQFGRRKRKSSFLAGAGSVRANRSDRKAPFL